MNYDQLKVDELPKRKPNSPEARIVCWKCKRGNVTLYRTVQKSKYIKPSLTRNIDYVCGDHRLEGAPPIGNQSRIYYHYKGE